MDGYHNSMIDNTDCHIPSQLMIFTSTMLHHALQEWEKTNGVHPTACTDLMLNADRPDRSNYFNTTNEG